MIKHIYSGIDPAEVARQRAAFMENPPQCSAFVSYQSNDDDFHGVFIFKASDVGLSASKLIEERNELVELHATQRWVQQRDESNDELTPVPQILINFNHLVHDLIALTLGHAKCNVCSQVFDMRQLNVGNLTIGSSVYQVVTCPNKHKLFSYEVMHFMRKRSDE